MAKINNLQKYKRAKLITKDLEQILPILDKTYHSLKPFMKYRSILEIIDSLSDAKMILQIHLNNEKKIINNKGEE